MLVLTRKVNQSIVIGDDVEVTVLAVSRDKIRLGISAPRDVTVHRKEIVMDLRGGAPLDEEAAARAEPIESSASRLGEKPGDGEG